jgi:hypothetical protein
VISTEQRPQRFLLVTAAALLVAGCGGSQEGGGETSSASPSASASESTPSGTTEQAPPANQLTIDVTIAGGQVTPANAQLQGRVGEPIVLQVSSDAVDELHVHSVPEHSFPVEAKPDQRFEFTVEVPGNVEIELHDLNRVIASVQVQQ